MLPPVVNQGHKWRKKVKLFLNGAIKIVHTLLWPHWHYPNINVSDRRNLLYDKSASFRCDGRLFHSLGPAAANDCIADGAVCPRHDAISARCGT